MRAVVLVKLDKIRPALVLTRDIALPWLDRVTIAPITSTIRGLSTEVLLGPANGLDQECVASCDNLTTVPRDAIVAQVGLLRATQEVELTRAISNAFDLT